MRTKFVISIFCFVAIFVAASDVVPVAVGKGVEEDVDSTGIKVSDTTDTRKIDTLELDSLQLAIYKQGR